MNLLKMIGESILLVLDWLRQIYVGIYNALDLPDWSLLIAALGIILLICGIKPSKK